MNATITLTRKDIEFVVLNPKSSSIHARRYPRDFTLCGQTLPSDTQIQDAATYPERKLAVYALCNRCYTTLRTFSSGVRIEAEVSEKEQA